MTDDNNKRPDLDKEIEELDQILEQQDPVDDYDLSELEFGEPEFEQSEAEARKAKKRQSGGGGFLGFLFVLLLLGGLGYAGYMYGPQLLGEDRFEELKTQGNDLLADMGLMDHDHDHAHMNDDSYQDMGMADTMDNVPMGNSWPLGDNDISVSVPSEPMMSDDMMDMTDQEPVTEGEEVAETIADALNIAQQATAEGMDAPSPSPESMPEMVNDDPMIMAEEGVDDLPMLDNERIYQEMAAADMPVSDIVEAVEDTAMITNDPLAVTDTDADTMMMESEPVPAVEEDTITDIANEFEAAAEEVIVVEEKIVQMPTAPKEEEPNPTASMNDEANKVTAAPKAEPKKAAPRAKRTTPKKIVTKRLDPRVREARMLMEEGNYMMALTTYQAVLSDDPADTAALTGRQLAQAKLRMQQQSQQQPMAEMPVTAPVQIETPMVEKEVSHSSPEIQSLLNLLRQSPRDAQVALQLAQAYQAASESTKAIEWYNKALQLDVFQPSGLDRMAVYDAIADLQE